LQITQSPNPFTAVGQVAVAIGIGLVDPKVVKETGGRLEEKEVDLDVVTKKREEFKVTARDVPSGQERDATGEAAGDGGAGFGIVEGAKEVGLVEDGGIGAGMGGCEFCA
jgi:hypothetical protein